MIFIRCLEFLLLLLLLLLRQVHAEEAEPVFRAEGDAIEMGYCFGVDYMVVYRSTPEGDELIGNSSANYIPFTTPGDLQGRIHSNVKDSLIGLIITHLTHMDSGIYRRECWQNQTLEGQHSVRLTVCNEEVEHEEIMVRNGDEEIEFLCNSTSIGLEGTSVRWYRETFPTYKVKLILDSSVSLDPLMEELQGAVGVRDNGALLLLNKTLLKNNQNFFCLVIKGEKCLSFQTMYRSDNIESRDIFASQGERVVLNCPADGDNQQWYTPLGQINGSSIKNDQMNTSSGDKSEDFSLVIATVSDEHIGDYSCISSSFELQYSLILCPKKASQERFALEGGRVWLECNSGEHDSQTVQWYRRKPSGEDELIYDSYDKTVPIPEDLMGRLTDFSFGLGISHLGEKDGGVYWCVVLSPEFLLDSDDYEDDYGDEDAEEDGYSDDPYWNDTHRCIAKQETLVSVKTRRRNLGFEPVTTKTRITSSTAGPPAASNVTTYAVVAGLVVLALGVTVAVIAIKKRANASQRQAASRSGLNTTKDIEMNADPALTERLTHNDTYGA